MRVPAKLSRHLCDGGYEEDPGKAGLPCAQSFEEVIPHPLVMVPEDLMKDEERAPVYLVEPGKVTREGNAECNRNVVLPAPAEAFDRHVVIHIARYRKIPGFIRSP